MSKYLNHISSNNAIDNQETGNNNYFTEDSLINISHTEGSTKNPYMAGDQFDNSTVLLILGYQMGLIIVHILMLLAQGLKILKVLLKRKIGIKVMMLRLRIKF